MVMPTRRLGRTDMTPSAIGLGAWAIGGSWGPVDDAQSMKTLHAAVDAGVNFIDTADVYGMGRSEKLVARLLRERPRDRIWVATKAGRKLPEQTLAGYSMTNLVGLGRREPDQPRHRDHRSAPTPLPAPGRVRQRRSVWLPRRPGGHGEDSVYGVSVETVDEARRAMVHPNVQSIQIIFNPFRIKPASALFELAREQ